MSVEEHSQDVVGRRSKKREIPQGESSSESLSGKGNQLSRGSHSGKENIETNETNLQTHNKGTRRERGAETSQKTKNITETPQVDNTEGTRISSQRLREKLAEKQESATKNQDGTSGTGEGDALEEVTASASAPSKRSKGTALEKVDSTGRENGTRRKTTERSLETKVEQSNQKRDPQSKRTSTEKEEANKVGQGERKKATPPQNTAEENKREPAKKQDNGQYNVARGNSKRGEPTGQVGAERDSEGGSTYEPRKGQAHPTQMSSPRGKTVDKMTRVQQREAIASRAKQREEVAQEQEPPLPPTEEKEVLDESAQKSVDAITNARKRREVGGGVDEEEFLPYQEDSTGDEEDEDDEEEDPYAMLTNKEAVPKKFESDVFAWLQSLVCTLSIVVVLFTFFLHLTRVSGSSMEPTLVDGELHLILSLGYTPQVGDVVIVNKPTITYLEGQSIVKRVIALGGQQVQIDYTNNQVLVDGVAIEEDYTLEPMEPIYGDEGLMEVIVPEGSIFVLGDNRNNSSDSRAMEIGTIDEGYVLGKMVVCLYPFTNMRIL